MATNNAANMYVTVGAAKQINMPVQPTFIVYNNATVDDVTGDATLYTCVFPAELIDIGGNFAANTFIAPVDGKYILETSILLAGVGAGHTEAIIYITTTSQTYSSYINSATAATSGGLLSLRLSTIANMAATDTAIIQLKISNSTKTVDYFGSAAPGLNTYFSGSLIA